MIRSRLCRTGLSDITRSLHGPECTENQLVALWNIFIVIQVDNVSLSGLILFRSLEGKGFPLFLLNLKNKQTQQYLNGPQSLFYATRT